MRAIPILLIGITLHGCQQRSQTASPHHADNVGVPKPADAAVNTDVPEDVQALVPMFIRWATEERPLSGQTDVRYGDTKWLRGVLDQASATAVYVTWNASADAGFERFRWKYELGSGLVKSLTAEDRARLEERWKGGTLTVAEQATFHVQATDNNSRKVSFQIGWVWGEFLLRQDGKQFIVEKTVGMFIS